MPHRVYAILTCLNICAILAGAVLLPAATALAQGDSRCPVMVNEALALVDDACTGLNRGEACYGHSMVDAIPRERAARLVFNNPADRLPLADVQQIITAPMNIARNQWGVAVLNLQVDIPNAMPGQAVTFLLMGDAEVADKTSQDENLRTRYRPMQAFFFTSGLAAPQCHQAAGTLLITNTYGVPVAFNVNGLDIALASTISLTTIQHPDDGRLMLIATVWEGTLTVSHPNFVLQLAEPGQSIAITLNDDRLVAANAELVDLQDAPDVIQRLQAACENGSGRGVLNSAAFPDVCFTPPEFITATTEDFTYYDIGLATECRNLQNVQVGELIGIQLGIGRWPTPATMHRALAGHRAVILLDDQPLPVFYEGATWHTGLGIPPGYGDRARALWTASQGTHTASSMWTLHDEWSTCTFTVR